MKATFSLTQRGLAMVAGLFLAVLPATGASLTWNGGVAGSWVDGGTGWLDGVSTTWNNANPDSATFNGTAPGTVSVGAGGITVDDVTISANGYTIGGAGTLTLAGTTVSVADGVTGTVTAALGGTTGLTKSGNGILELSGANKTYTGATVINAGAIRIGAVGAGILGATATQEVQLAGGRLEALFAANQTVSNRVIVGVSGGEIRNLGTDSQRWVINSGAISGAGVLTMSFGASNTRYQILGGQNGFTGKWVIDCDANQSKLLDLFSSTTFGGATGADAITLVDGGTIALRNGVTLGNVTQGVTLAGTAQARISATGGSTVTVAAAISGPSTSPLQIFSETASSLLTLSNSANSWLGETTLAGLGIVRLGAAGVLPDAGGNVVINSTTILDLNGFSETVGGLFGAGTVDNRAASSEATLTVGGNNNSPTFSGVITNSGTSASISLVKIGTGTQSFNNALGGVNGSVIVSNGVLVLSSTASLANASTIDVRQGAALQVTARTDGTLTVGASQALSGDGTIRGVVTNAGIVSPGTGIGTLSVSGRYVQTASGELDIQLAATNSHDVLWIASSCSLDGALTVSLDSFSPAIGDTFTILASTGVGGQFAATNLPSLSGGLGWVVTYQPSSVVVSVTGSVATGYALWATGITNGLTNVWDSSTQDGYPNLVKYATGSSPTTPDLLAKMDATRTNGALALVFNRNTNATDLVYVVQGATAISNNTTWVGIATNIAGLWTTPGVVESGSGSPVKVVVPDTVTGVPSRFLRLSVYQAP